VIAKSQSALFAYKIEIDCAIPLSQVLSSLWPFRIETRDATKVKLALESKRSFSIASLQRHSHSLARLVLSLLVKFDVVGMRSALSRHKVDVRFGERPPFCRASIYFPFHVLSPCAGTRLFWRMFYYFAAAFQVCRPRAAVLLFVWLRTQHSSNPKNANRTPYKSLLSNRNPRKFQKICL
jgi:hypothetical protein